MAATGPAVSIIVPAFNERSHITQAIESVRAQSFADFECIISDDASKDDTFQVAEEAVAGDTRFRLFRQESNLGMGPNWNFCLTHITGRYIVKLDADDYWEPDYLSACLQAFEARPDTAFIFTHIFTFGPNDQHYANLWPNAPERMHGGGSISGPEMLDWMLDHGNFITSSSVMWRADVMSRSGPFDERVIHCTDMEMWLRLATLGDAYCIPRRLVHYRFHSESETARETESSLGVWHTAEALQLALDAYYQHERLDRATYIEKREQLRRRVIKHYVPQPLIELYWSDKRAFSQANSSAVPLRSGLCTYTLRAVLGPNESLRLDPVNRPGLVAINSIRLVGPGDRTIGNWDSPEALRQWRASSNALVLGGPIYGLLALTHDPQLTLDCDGLLDAPTEVQIELALEFTDAEERVGPIASQIVAALSPKAAV